ncbi:MAG: hypothetical protein JSS50_01145 [Proteobacteria bacterium]|nr:hypothetical protein [Pseudomonadota bacterium]
MLDSRLADLYTKLYAFAEKLEQNKSDFPGDAQTPLMNILTGITSPKHIQTPSQLASKTQELCAALIETIHLVQHASYSQKKTEEEKNKRRQASKELIKQVLPDIFATLSQWIKATRTLPQPDFQVLKTNELTNPNQVPVFGYADPTHSLNRLHDCILIILYPKYYLAQRKFIQNSELTENAVSILDSLLFWCAPEQLADNLYTPVNNDDIHPLRLIDLIAYYRPATLLNILESEYYKKRYADDFTKPILQGLISRSVKQGWSEAGVNRIKKLLEDDQSSSTSPQAVLPSPGKTLSDAVMSVMKVHDLGDVKDYDLDKELAARVERFLQWGGSLSIDINGRSILGHALNEALSSHVSKSHKWRVVNKLIDLLARHGALSQMLPQLPATQIMQYAHYSVIEKLLDNGWQPEKSPTILRDFLSGNITTPAFKADFTERTTEQQQEVHDVQRIRDKLLKYVRATPEQTAHGLWTVSYACSAPLNAGSAEIQSVFNALIAEEQVRVAEATALGQPLSKSCFSMPMIYGESVLASNLLSPSSLFYSMVYEWVEGIRKNTLFPDPAGYAFHKAAIKEALLSKTPYGELVASVILKGDDDAKARSTEKPKRGELSEEARAELQSLITTYHAPKRAGGALIGIGTLAAALGGVALFMPEMQLALGSNIMLSDALFLSGAALGLIGAAVLVADLSSKKPFAKAGFTIAAILAGPAIVGTSMHLPQLIAEQMRFGIAPSQVTLGIGIIVGLVAGLVLGTSVYQHHKESIEVGLKKKANFTEARAKATLWWENAYTAAAVAATAGAITGAVISGALPLCSNVISNEPMLRATILVTAACLSALVSVVFMDSARPRG